MPRRAKDAPTAKLLRRMRGQLFRASHLLDQPDDPGRRRRLLDALAPDAERIGTAGAAILSLRLRLPYRQTDESDVLVFPGGLAPRPPDREAIAQLARQPELAGAPLGRLVVLDTETTGLLDKAETVPFLVGLGRFGTRAFFLEQYFMEDLESEPELMRQLERRLRDFRAILTYNGAAFDLPLLRRRFAVQHLPETTWRRPHWDVLPMTRALWKERSGNCSLTNLERELFGFHRRRDIDANRIPRVYHDYLGGRRAERLAAVFDHNAQDILTTAALAVTLARILRKPKDALARQWADKPALDRFLARIAGGRKRKGL